MVKKITKEQASHIPKEAYEALDYIRYLTKVLIDTQDRLRELEFEQLGNGKIYADYEYTKSQAVEYNLAKKIYEVEQVARSTKQLSLDKILLFCKTENQKEIAKLYYNKSLNCYNSFQKVADIYYPGDPNGRQKVYSTIQTIIKGAK